MKKLFSWEKTSSYDEFKQDLKDLQARLKQRSSQDLSQLEKKNCQNEFSSIISLVEHISKPKQKLKASEKIEEFRKQFPFLKHSNSQNQKFDKNTRYNSQTCLNKETPLTELRKNSFADSEEVINNSEKVNDKGSTSESFSGAWSRKSGPLKNSDLDQKEKIDEKFEVHVFSGQLDQKFQLFLDQQDSSNVETKVSDNFGNKQLENKNEDKAKHFQHQSLMSLNEKKDAQPNYAASELLRQNNSRSTPTDIRRYSYLDILEENKNPKEFNHTHSFIVHRRSYEHANVHQSQTSQQSFCSGSSQSMVTTASTISQQPDTSFHMKPDKDWMTQQRSSTPTREHNPYVADRAQTPTCKNVSVQSSHHFKNESSETSNFNFGSNRPPEAQQRSLTPTRSQNSDVTDRMQTPKCKNVAVQSFHQFKNESSETSHCNFGSNRPREEQQRSLTPTRGQNSDVTDRMQTPKYQNVAVQYFQNYEIESHNVGTNSQQETVFSLVDKRFARDEVRGRGRFKTADNNQPSKPRFAGPLIAQYPETPQIEIAEQAQEEVIIDVHQFFQNDLDLNSLDPSDSNSLNIIHQNALIFQDKVNNFKEEKHSLEYFVLDEKLQRMVDKLDRMKFQNDDDTSHQISIIKYITNLQRQLDLKAK